MHNDTQQNDTQHDDIQRNGTQHTVLSTVRLSKMIISVMPLSMKTYSSTIKLCHIEYNNVLSAMFLSVVAPNLCVGMKMYSPSQANNGTEFNRHLYRN